MDRNNETESDFFFQIRIQKKTTVISGLQQVENSEGPVLLHNLPLEEPALPSLRQTFLSSLLQAFLSFPIWALLLPQTVPSATPA